jgi:hypothetical protein
LTFSFNKEYVGYIVVIVDLFIGILVFLLLAFMGNNIEHVRNDVDKANITASDFTVEIRGTLPVSEQYPAGPLGLDLFRAELWKWIETTCKEHGGEPAQCPDTMSNDDYQNNLGLLYFAMSDLDRMKLLQRIGVVIQKEKIIQASIEAYPERKYEFQEEQLTINAEKKTVL